MKQIFFIATLITLIFISSAQAAKWAILVGIDDYENPEINDQKCAVADVTEFKKALIEVGEFEPDNIFLMTDESKGEERPTNTNILYKVGTLANIMEPQDTFIFYFSGHGMMRDGKAFLLSINADPRSADTLELSGVPMDKLRERMNKIKARQVLFIVDACRNDPEAGRGDKDNLLTDDFAKNVRAMPGSNNSGVPSATATLYSCSEGERAYEYHEKGQGVFSYFLVKGLRGDKATDSDGNITVNLLADYTQREVAKWAKRKNKKQTPWLIQEGAGKIVIAQISLTSQLELSTRPAGAMIYIDQIPYGITPKTVEIDIGIQKEKELEVALVLDGYKTEIASVTARRGGKSKWTGIELEPVEVGNNKPAIDLEAELLEALQSAKQSRQGAEQSMQELKEEIDKTYEILRKYESEHTTFGKTVYIATLMMGSDDRDLMNAITRLNAIIRVKEFMPQDEQHNAQTKAEEAKLLLPQLMKRIQTAFHIGTPLRIDTNNTALSPSEKALTKRINAWADAWQDGVGKNETELEDALDYYLSFYADDMRCSRWVTIDGKLYPSGDLTKNPLRIRMKRLWPKYNNIRVNIVPFGHDYLVIKSVEYTYRREFTYRSEVEIQYWRNINGDWVITHENWIH